MLPLLLRQRPIAGASILVLWLSCSGAFGASIVFEFAGDFGTCEGTCTGNPLSSLDGASLSGTITIPASAPDRSPDVQNRPFSDDMLWSYYVLSGPDAAFSLETEGQLFDLSLATPVRAIVSHCQTGPSCSPNRNFVWFEYLTSEYGFMFGFSSVAETDFHSTSIPAANEYSRFRATGFDIYERSFDASITTYSDGGGNFDVSVTLVPIPGGIGLLALPLFALLTNGSRVPRGASTERPFAGISQRTQIAPNQAVNRDA